MQFFIPVLWLFLTTQSSPPPQQNFAQEIIVTASGVPESVESTPASVTVIRKKELDERAVRDVADALRTVPGLMVIRGGSSGKLTTLFTRGSNSTHTLVLWNGLEANNPFFSGYDWGRFSTAGVYRIEVVRGPYSALYGSEAVAGVVNVISDAPRDAVEVGVQAGDNGLLDGAFRGSFSAGRWTGDAVFEARQDDGFAANDDFDQQTAMLGGRWSNGHLSIGLNARYMNYDLGIPFNVNAAGDAFEPRPFRREGGDELQIALPLRLTRGRWDYQLTLSRNQNSLDFEDPDDPFGRVSANTDTESDRVLFTTRLTTRLGTWVGGAEYEDASVTDVSSYGLNIDDRPRRSRSVFIEDRISLKGGVELTAGVRHDDFDTFGSETSPRIAAAWRFRQNKIRGAAGRAFRAPSIGELYIPFFGNSELEAERSRSFEVGYDRYFDSGAAINVTLFQSDFDNLIVYDTVSNVFQNIGEAESEGLELGFEAPITARLQVGGSYTRLRTRALATGLSLLRRPEDSGSLHTRYLAGPILTSLTIVHSGARADVTDLFPYNRVISDAYTVGDLKVELDRGSLKPYVKVENLADEVYQEAFGYPSPRRRFIAGFRWNASPARRNP